MAKNYPVYTVENLGDDDSNYWFVRAQRGKFMGFGTGNDSLKAREKALASLERNESNSNYRNHSLEPNGDRIDEI